VLPLFLVKSLLAGRLLVSVPYATYGGILADSHEAATALLRAAQELCRRFRARYLELRHREPNGLGLPEIDRYDTFRKMLPERVEDVMASLPRKTRAAARNGLKALGEDCIAVGPEWLDAIYNLYCITLRRLGSPNYSRRLFHSLLKHYGDDCVCLVVLDKGEPVAGVVSIVFRDEIVPCSSGSADVGMQRDANNVMYLRLMEYAVRRGLRWFDFNRTRRDNPGPYDFKRHHGFEPAPLHYQFYLNGGGPLPNLSPSNKKYALAGRLWQHLPLWLTRPAGARITKWVP
jgi:FemAB-related protein (PEP-CTERM system-associated)